MNINFGSVQVKSASQLYVFISYDYNICLYLVDFKKQLIVSESTTPSGKL